MLKYIELTDDKRPVGSFDTIVIDYTTIENAGLLLNTKTVVIDFDNDNVDEAKIVDHLVQHFPTQMVKTTRGTHLYYRIPDGMTIKNGADKITMGGFQVDYKTGTRSYTIVKHKGKVREGAENITLKDLPELPLVCYPLPKAKNISGLDDGDGRNNAMFYHLRLIREQFTDIDLNVVADFVNTVLFKKPFDKKELETLINSVAELEVNSAGQYNGKPSNMIEYGKFLAKEADVQIFQQQLYFRRGLNYSKDQIELQKKSNEFLELKKAQYAELTHQLYTYGNTVPPKTEFKVRLRNGVIIEDNVADYDTGFTPFYMDVVYDPEAYDGYVDSFLDFITCDRADMRVVVEEIIGHILLAHKFPHKIFFLTGSGANGKSTFIEMITKFTGDLSSHVDISQFDDGTSLTSLIGKLVNVADDVDALYLEKSKNLKTMASGNTVGARAIYSQPVTIKNTATLIFTANEPPTFKDKSDGIGRRLLIIPFENKVTSRIHDLDELLSTDQAKSYLLNLGLAAIKRIMDNKFELTISETITNATKQYHIDNDSVLGYITAFPDIEGNPVADTYEAYAEYADESNLRPVSLNKFTRRLKTLGYEYKLETMMGKSIRVIKKGTKPAKVAKTLTARDGK